MTKADWNNRKGRSSSWITKHRRLAIYLRDGFCCMYCGKDLRNAAPREVTLEHLECQNDHPSGKLPNGKSLHHESNLVTACLSCNSGRSDLVKWYKYATRGAKERIQRQRRRVLNIDLAKAILAGEVSREEAVLEAV